MGIFIGHGDGSPESDAYMRRAYDRFCKTTNVYHSFSYQVCEKHSEQLRFWQMDLKATDETLEKIKLEISECPDCKSRKVYNVTK